MTVNGYGFSLRSELPKLLLKLILKTVQLPNEPPGRFKVTLSTKNDF